MQLTSSTTNKKLVSRKDRKVKDPSLYAYEPIWIQRTFYMDTAVKKRRHGSQVRTLLILCYRVNYQEFFYSFSRFQSHLILVASLTKMLTGDVPPECLDKP